MNVIDAVTAALTPLAVGCAMWLAATRAAGSRPAWWWASLVWGCAAVTVGAVEVLYGQPLAAVLAGVNLAGAVGVWRWRSVRARRARHRPHRALL